MKPSRAMEEPIIGIWQEQAGARRAKSAVNASPIWVLGIPMPSD